MHHCYHTHVTCQSRCSEPESCRDSAGLRAGPGGLTDWQCRRIRGSVALAASGPDPGEPHRHCHRDQCHCLACCRHGGYTMLYNAAVTEPAIQGRGPLKFPSLQAVHWQVEFWAVGQVRRAGAGGPLARAWPGTIDVLTSGTFSAPILQSPIRHYTLSTGRPRCRWAGSSPDRTVDIFDAAAALNLNDEKNSYSAFEGSSWYGTVYNLHWHKMITILMQIKIGIDFQIGFIAISRAATLLLKFKMD